MLSKSRGNFASEPVTAQRRSLIRFECLDQRSSTSAKCGFKCALNVTQNVALMLQFA